MQTTILRLATAASIGLLFTSCRKESASSDDDATAAESKSGHVLAVKQHTLPAGTTGTREAVMTLTDAALKITAGPQEMSGTMNQKEVSTETREFISATKVRHILTQKESEGKMTLNGENQPVPSEDAALLNEPVILELNGDTWTASLESGSEPSAAQQTELDALVKASNKDADYHMYGDTPRKPGDKWDVDASKLPGFAEAENLEGTFSVEFVEVKDFQGTACAVLKSTFDIKGKPSEDEESAEMTISIKGTSTVHRSLADMTDLDMQLEGTMSVSGSPNAQVSMEMSGPMTMSQKITLKSP